jgi:hypothetical protein
MRVVPGGASVGDMATCRRDLAPDCYRGVPTYSCCCNAGSLWELEAADRVPIRDLLAGCQDSTAALGPQGTGRWCELRRSLDVPSPWDGEVIWKGSGGGESASVWIHAMNCVIAPVDSISDQVAALLRRGLRRTVWKNEKSLGTPLHFPPSIASFGGLDENAGGIVTVGG